MTNETKYKNLSTAEFMQAVGIDGAKWAEAFMELHGDKKPDADNMLGWFCNAIMAGYDHGGAIRTKENRKLREAVVILPDDAEPQVEDVVEFSDIADVPVLENSKYIEELKKGKSHEECFDAALLYYKTEISPYQRIMRINKHFAGKPYSDMRCRILSRNGKPVVYESALKAGGGE